jgi:hypothetical protein
MQENTKPSTIMGESHPQNTILMPPGTIKDDLSEKDTELSP